MLIFQRMAKAKSRPYKSPVRERQAGDTRRRIVEAARQLLEREGYAGMTVETIAQRAGVSLRSIHELLEDHLQVEDRNPYRTP